MCTKYLESYPLLHCVWCSLLFTQYKLRILISKATRKYSEQHLVEGFWSIGLFCVGGYARGRVFTKMCRLCCWSPPLSQHLLAVTYVNWLSRFQSKRSSRDHHLERAGLLRGSLNNLRANWWSVSYQISHLYQVESNWSQLISLCTSHHQHKRWGVYWHTTSHFICYLV